MHLTACLSAMTAILTMSFPTVSPTPSLSPYLLSSSSFHLVNPPHSHLAPASQTPATNSMQALANDHRLSRDCSMYHDGAKRCSYYRGEVQICEGGIWRFWEDCEGSWYCGDYDELGINVTCIPNEYWWGEHGLKPVVEPYR
jgi:hypothetical protein